MLGWSRGLAKNQVQTDQKSQIFDLNLQLYILVITCNDL